MQNNRPVRGSRKDYKKMNDGDTLPGIFSPLKADKGGDSHSGEDGEDVAQDDETARLRLELEECEREEAALLKKREAELLREQIDRKKESISKLRGEVDRKTKPLSLADLRKDRSLSKKVQKACRNSGFEFLQSSCSELSLSESDSDSEVDLKSTSKRSACKQSRLTEKDISEDETSRHSKKSGITAKASDVVRNKQFYPQSHLRYEFVNDSVTFDKLDINLFVAGELEIITSRNTKKSESKARIELLKRMMYLNASYDFIVVKNLYAAILREIELGNKVWGDDFQYVEIAVLSNRYPARSQIKRAPLKSANGTDSSVWFCSQYQKNKCSQKAPHTLVVKGVMRLAHHICATCYQKDKKQLDHPECSSACPHASD